MAIYRTGKIGDGGGGGGGAFPADVFVVLLKPRVNYARGINERPEQRDRIEIPASSDRNNRNDRVLESRSDVKYIGQPDHRAVQSIESLNSILTQTKNDEAKTRLMKMIAVIRLFFFCFLTTKWNIFSNMNWLYIS